MITTTQFNSKAPASVSPPEILAIGGDPTTIYNKASEPALRALFVQSLGAENVYWAINQDPTIILYHGYLATSNTLMLDCDMISPQTVALISTGGGANVSVIKYYRNDGRTI